MRIGKRGADALDILRAAIVAWLLGVEAAAHTVRTAEPQYMHREMHGYAPARFVLSRNLPVMWLLRATRLHPAIRMVFAPPGHPVHAAALGPALVAVGLAVVAANGDPGQVAAATAASDIHLACGARRSDLRATCAAQAALY